MGDSIRVAATAVLIGELARAGPGPARTGSWRGGEALRTARTCYDHLAGRLGVALADALTGRGYVALSADGGEVTEPGWRFLDTFGARPAVGRGMFCRPCLDWSERRPHLAGRIDAALACRCFELGWIARQRDTRAVAITKAGMAGFRERFAHLARSGSRCENLMLSRILRHHSTTPPAPPRHNGMLF